MTKTKIMSKKLYFADGYEYLATIKQWKLTMKEEYLTELKLNRAIRDIGQGYFFCKEYQEIGEVGESCGKQCGKYAPNNGKNGRCKHYGWCYEKTNETLTIKL